MCLPVMGQVGHFSEDLATGLATVNLGGGVLLGGLKKVGQVVLLKTVAVVLVVKAGGVRGVLYAIVPGNMC